jgi:hypothetical protein
MSFFKVFFAWKCIKIMFFFKKNIFDIGISKKFKKYQKTNLKQKKSKMFLKSY